MFLGLCSGLTSTLDNRNTTVVDYIVTCFSPNISDLRRAAGNTGNKNSHVKYFTAHSYELKQHFPLMCKANFNFHDGIYETQFLDLNIPDFITSSI